MWDDPIVAEVRAVRERLAAKFGFDAHLIFKDLRKRQARLGDRVVRAPRKAKAKPAAAPVRRAAPLPAGKRA